MAVECSPYPLVAIDLSVLERWAHNCAMYRRLAWEVEDESIVCKLDPTKLNPTKATLIQPTYPYPEMCQQSDLGQLKA